MKQLLLGDEAIAQGAIDAGLSGVYAYPGTPSTEITEYIQLKAKSQELRANNQPIHCRWAANEKTAMEAALGMSYMGKRALVCMKHVGMNVCADAFMNAAITGVNGGLIVLAADDPSMHSSLAILCQVRDDPMPGARQPAGGVRHDGVRVRVERAVEDAGTDARDDPYGAQPSRGEHDRHAA